VLLLGACELINMYASKGKTSNNSAENIGCHLAVFSFSGSQMLGFMHPWF